MSVVWFMLFEICCVRYVVQCMIMRYVVWCMLHKVCCTMYVYKVCCTMYVYQVCCMLHKVYFTMYVVWGMSYDVCCMRYAVRCMLYEVCCVCHRLTFYLSSFNLPWPFPELLKFPLTFHHLSFFICQQYRFSYQHFPPFSFSPIFTLLLFIQKKEEISSPKFQPYNCKILRRHIVNMHI